MSEGLLSFVEVLKKKRVSDFPDEAATKQAIILKLLSLLDWDAFNIDEVKPEYTVAGGRVDYSLRIGGKDKVFIEAKKAGEELEGHEEQLLNYSFKNGVKIAVLTNGFEWWFYLPLSEGSWEQRKFYTIDVLQQESSDVVSKFADFLSKDNVNNEKALENAEAVYKSQQKKNILKDNLPKAWQRLISEPDDRLIELITNKTEEICGFKADAEMVEQFLLKSGSQARVSAPQTDRPVPPYTKRGPSVSTTPISGNYANRPISAFVFSGTQHRVRSYKDLLMSMCDILIEKHGSELDKVLNIRGRKRPYFTRNSNELRIPLEVNETGIFVETNLSANSIVKLCTDMLALFGYSEDELKIETL
jgi:predicted type IV restriction endonuclease